MNVPVAKVHIFKGKSQAHRDIVRNAVRDSIAGAFRIRPQDVTQLWWEFEVGQIDGKGENFIYIEILALQGRTVAAKRALYRQLVDQICAGGSEQSTEVLIQVFDIPKENCGTRGGQMAADLDLGFETNV